MMRYYLVVLVGLMSNLVCNESSVNTSFITTKEYGAMLYTNPRGIGCHQCHGLQGQGLLIAQYRYKDKKSNKMVSKKIIAPPINRVDFKTFKETLTRDAKESLIMPTYFLTLEELTSIHHYITNLDTP